MRFDKSRKGMKKEPKYVECDICGRNRLRENVDQYGCGHDVCNENTLNNCGWWMLQPVLVSGWADPINYKGWFTIRDRSKCPNCGGISGGKLKPLIAL